MKCKKCGFEMMENTDVCPCCGTPQSAPRVNFSRPRYAQLNQVGSTPFKDKKGCMSYIIKGTAYGVVLFGSAFGIIGTALGLAVAVVLGILIYREHKRKSDLRYDGIHPVDAANKEDALYAMINSALDKSTNEMQKPIARGMLLRRIVISACFAGLMWLFLEFFYYSLTIFGILGVLALIYERVILSCNTRKIIYKKIKKTPGITPEMIIANDTYNESEEPKLRKVNVICAVIFLVLIAIFGFMHTESKFSFEPTDGGYTVESYYPSLFQMTEMEIPEIHNGKSVVAISDEAFSLQSYLKRVDIPKSVKSIGNSAFSQCFSLEETELPSGLTEIGTEAFYGCKKLRNVTIPKGVTVLEDSVFYDCKNLEIVKLHDGITEIKASAFSYCSSLSEITLPSAITEIQDYTFDGCESLQRIVIPNGVKKIGVDAFYGCTMLENVILPDSLKLIESGAFSFCSSLEVIDLPPEVTVHEDAFLDSPTVYSGVSENSETKEENNNKA